MEELDWAGRAGLGMGGAPRVQGSFAALSSLGLHCCLIFKYRSILCNICHKFTFQSDLLSEIQMGFKWHFHSSAPGSLLLSLMLQRTGKWERERPEHNRGRER